MASASPNDPAAPTATSSTELCRTAEPPWAAAGSRSAAASKPTAANVIAFPSQHSAPVATATTSAG
eukprot:scaffold645_cov247-Pinguiococcus_pyrenoidosus.AAC.10